MRIALVAASLAAIGPLSACTAGAGSSPEHCEDPAVGCAAANVAHVMRGAPFESSWTDVNPDFRFSGDREAARIGMTLPLRDAEFGFFSDPAIRRQYSHAQLEQMRRDGAGFSVSLDRDGNGRAETYRTGFWRERSGREGTFLAVFDPMFGDQAIITSPGAAEAEFASWDAGVFLSWRNGELRVANCNCPRSGAVEYQGGLLTVTWTGPQSME